MKDIKYYIRQYSKEVLEKYPDLDLKQINDCCRYPFVYTDKVLRDDSLGDMRLKYLGTFRVSESKIRDALKRAYMNKVFERVTEKWFINRFNILQKRLTKWYEYSEKFKEKVLAAKAKQK